jgi:hypothetical protein
LLNCRKSADQAAATEVDAMTANCAKNCKRKRENIPASVTAELGLTARN